MAMRLTSLCVLSWVLLLATSLDAARSSKAPQLKPLTTTQDGALKRAKKWQRAGIVKPSGQLQVEEKEDQSHTLKDIKERILAGAAKDRLRLEQPFVQNTKFCEKKSYRKAALKQVRESPFLGLFKDLKNFTQFEGSSITYAKGMFYIVFDSLRALGRVNEQFQFRGAENVLIPEDAGETESQFEGLQYMPSTDSFIAVRESIEHDSHGLVPLTEEIIINKNGDMWTLGEVCPVKFYGLEDVNKGWESIYYYEEGGDKFLLGVCESNYCKTILGDDPPGLQRGNGRAVLTKHVKGDDEDSCHWEVVKEMNIPEEAYFLDYAGIAFYGGPTNAQKGSRVALVSQEDSAIWVGEFDWEALEFVPGGKVFHFPRDVNCDKMYCNVEGLYWLDSQRLIFASDRSKSIQPFTCIAKDQSVHIMSLPN
mmetsp:Transcript_2562/g.4346  ORF Transcript_2562/g.4346 Transcript_2562/m.4346 type:complete len:422 (+) Transcript_2562:53-1318(+)|eukprot:CAMPEP_0119101592 /NCGR_PEP_ID=MMETSP1180-20130426/610_1 /TAXON_ID=3052 ORGANISM="Chlamydomonas cf sp, Strain CCMP681" /NCGR_SAMPLE_ID=MMETSP1180 /ASSEMBLY_ACC=CAM_ASM_000741 /LENGTH=421 /DNA_ID=CAMNT_0007085737 /DNA_START=41 /DNA_END=1306 /DNA_ORIENTATION=+